MKLPLEVTDITEVLTKIDMTTKITRNIKYIILLPTWKLKDRNHFH